jgi:hypothetical protein
MEIEAESVEATTAETEATESEEVEDVVAEEAEAAAGAATTTIETRTEISSRSSHDFGTTLVALYGHYDFPASSAMAFLGE